MFRSGDESRALLGQKAGGAPLSSAEALVWACDVSRDPDSVGSAAGATKERSYRTLLPWDTLFLLILAGCCGAFGAFLPMLLIRAATGTWLPLPPHVVALLPEIMWCALPCAMAFLFVVVCQVPLRVTREPDAFVIDFPFARHVVNLGEVLEVVVLNYAMVQEFVAVLHKWAIFPFGGKMRCFRGLPSQQGVLCMLLTRHTFWSYLFCVEDPVQFLLDNQRPLDLKAKYWTTHRVQVREGIDLTSPKACIVTQGHSLRIEKQRGRRIYVNFESCKVTGWMSYISVAGDFLIAKDRQQSSGALQGVVGASELARSYGGIELRELVTAKCGGTVE